ncbi:glycosyl hydrolase [Flavisolibacter ginsenosidimutans]|uniref:DNA-binding protein n=1 Tax=Flavisolibacter ginsenosidimutans TaxID=661481 RepID=A0A5B8UGC9_9BACT|nr:glycosyl hydrolase [Flavisolibacter ginsenosidimutans]QEC55654.1 DNA-binding protein [Flavisolibacter ginsenosidimutans]
MKKFILFLALSFCITSSFAQTDLRKVFQSPPDAAKPWVFWYWLNGAVSAEGITADLEAMKRGGVAGAYLMPIKDTTSPSIYPNPARQLSPQWWKMIKFAMSESKRLGLKLAFHVSDGFALAGGPWITPENSMQKVVWSQVNLQGGKVFSDTLPKPKALENYYEDIAVFAFPSLPGTGVSTRTVKPKITTSTGVDAQFLAEPNNTKSFSSDDSCWIQYSFEKPFTLRSLVVKNWLYGRSAYITNHLIIETSDDGKNFHFYTRLEAPRHGWQDWDSDYTHAIPEVTSRYFRFVYSKRGIEPGAEDLDAAKWKASLNIKGLGLSSEPRIHQYEGKNGEVWRVSKRTTDTQLSSQDFVSLKNIIDITKYLDKAGKLTWNVPAGNWTIIRIGHTSTGHRNETGGGGKGLECDKFSPDAVTLQFNNWFGEIMKQGGATAKEVVKIFHVDSWECGSQNWSKNFREEFKKRRGYDLYAYLPVMAGIPVESNKVSEGVLYDVRRTISDLLNDKFYGTLQTLAHKAGMQFSAESVAPTMLSDGMQHYAKVDLPMGEFWLRSPTHDKPNDMLDAISGAHVYGKNIIQAEAFTEIRQAFDEHPGMLKALADRNFALGINRLVFHVFMHNPWLAKKPGVTLDAIGLLFQRDQTWWPRVSVWTDYIKRCQGLLQMGKPVTDIAVFTGEEYPRRSLLPERLVPTLPGLFGKEAAEREAKRLANEGVPTRKPENGVTYVANTSDAQLWNDPLRGYAYDSYNPDALLNLSSVRGNNISLSTGANYKLLVVPDVHKMLPDSGSLSVEAAKKIVALAKDGATVLLANEGKITFGLKDDKSELQKVFASFSANSTNGSTHVVGKGKVITGVFNQKSLEGLSIAPDFMATTDNGNRADSLVWTHRAGKDFDIYFVSNQAAAARDLTLSLRVAGKVPQLWNAVDGSITTASEWTMSEGRTELPVHLEGYGSVFVVLQQPTKKAAKAPASERKVVATITSPWTVNFDPALGGPAKPLTWPTLMDWSRSEDSAVRYYSGAAVYQNTFSWKPGKRAAHVWLNLGEVANMATVWVNDKLCGTIWTAPYRLPITNALKPGVNKIKIEVINTWANRMIGDARLPVERRISSTVYPFKMEGKVLLRAGLLGPVRVESFYK